MYFIQNILETSVDFQTELKELCPKRPELEIIQKQTEYKSKSSFTRIYVDGLLTDYAVPKLKMLFLATYIWL